MGGLDFCLKVFSSGLLPSFGFWVSSNGKPLRLFTYVANRLVSLHLDVVAPLYLGLLALRWDSFWTVRRLK